MGHINRSGGFLRARFEQPERRGLMRGREFLRRFDNVDGQSEAPAQRLRDLRESDQTSIDQNSSSAC